MKVGAVLILLCSATLDCRGSQEADSSRTELGPVTASCPLPLPGWYEPTTGGTAGPATSAIRRDRRAVTFRGDQTNEADLREYLRLSRSLLPTPIVLFDPYGGADCAFASRIRDVIHDEFDCRRNKCWQGTRKAYNDAPLREGEIVLPW